MRSLSLVLAVLGVTACATGTQPAASRLPFCNPCSNPCPSDNCPGKKVEPPPPPPAPVVAPAETPRFDPAAGTFTGAQSATITCATPGSKIYFTTDGSAPTEASPVYTAPIEIKETTTINAVCIAPAVPASQVATGTYTIQPPPRVVVTEKKLEIKETIFFDTGKATIQEKSHSLLDEVAGVMKDHPEIKKVSIEGHTDSTGKRAFNNKLSKNRANAVQSYLVGKGVDPARLSTKGFGPSKPIADNKTAEGRDKNRRVEFMIIDPRPAGEPEPAAPPAPKAKTRTKAKAKAKAAETKAGAEVKAAEAKVGAEVKAAETKAKAEVKAAEDKAKADLKKAAGTN